MGLGKIYIGLVTTMTKHYTSEGTLLIRNSDIKDGRFEFGDKPIYLEKSFAQKNESRMHQVGDVITVHTGDVGTSAVITENEVKSIGFATIVTRPDQQIIDANYLCTFLNTDKHKKWAVAISTGDGRTNYNLGDYYELVVPIPSIREQQKISSFVLDLDNLITLHQSKSFWYILKSILSCTLYWEQRKLGEIAERIIRKNEKLESTLPLTISAQYGLIDQNEFFDKRIASKDVRGYYLIKKGEFAYNKSTSVDAPFGAIKRLDKYKNGVLSTLYILFKIIDDTSTSSDYLVTYYFTDLWHNGIQSIAAEGARNHGLLNIAPNDFFETMLSIPLNISEQKKVGGFFISLDHLITLHQLEPFQLIFKAIAYRIIDYAKSKPPRCIK